MQEKSRQIDVIQFCQFLAETYHSQLPFFLSHSVLPNQQPESTEGKSNLVCLKFVQSLHC